MINKISLGQQELLRNMTQWDVISCVPFKPRYQHAYSPHCSPHVSYDTTWENLLKHQDIDTTQASLVIISFILITCMFDESVIL